MNSRSAKAKSRGKKLTLNKRTLRDLSAGDKGAAGVRGGVARIRVKSETCQGGGGADCPAGQGS